MIKDIVVAAVGCIAIVIGCVGKNFYYVKGRQAAVASNKSAPTWLGRTMFLVLGILLVAFSLRHLLFGQ
jgi:hypothetical protein